MTRTPKVLIACCAVALALTGCGTPAAAPAGEVAAESVALETVGYTTAETDADRAEPGVRPRAVRKLLRRNALHGEVVVQGPAEQTRTVVVQRGAVTAADDKGFTVRSADGFELTWTFGDKLRVRAGREPAGRSAVRTGVTVGVGGIRDGSATAARLVVVG